MGLGLADFLQLGRELSIDWTTGYINAAFSAAFLRAFF
jgi:hypothetical protein